MVDMLAKAFLRLVAVMVAISFILVLFIIAGIEL